MDRTYVAESDAERERLSSLVTALSDEALSRPMPAGWTVAAVLARLSRAIHRKEHLDDIERALRA